MRSEMLTEGQRAGGESTQDNVQVAELSPEISVQSTANGKAKQPTRVPVCTGCKRRKTCALDCQQVLGEVRATVLAGPTPPLMHSPRSMFVMLCDCFEQEFPGLLQQDLKQQLLQSLGHDACASRVRASNAT